MCINVVPEVLGGMCWSKSLNQRREVTPPNSLNPDYRLRGSVWFLKCASPTPHLHFEKKRLESRSPGNSVHMGHRLIVTDFIVSIFMVLFLVNKAFHIQEHF